jgi:hypothetical protein
MIKLYTGGLYTLCTVLLVLSVSLIPFASAEQAFSGLDGSTMCVVRNYWIISCFYRRCEITP